MTTPSKPTAFANITPAQRRGMVVAISAITGVGIGLSLSLPLLGIILESRGISGTWIGINTAMAGIAAIAISPFCTPLARRFGASTVLAASIWISAVTLLGFYYIEAFWAWFPLRLVFYAGITAAFVLSEFWINVLAPQNRRGLVMGIYGTVLSIGFSIGPAMIMLTGTDGIMPFALGASIMALSAIPVIAIKSDQPKLDSHSGASFASFLFAAPMATFAAFIFGAVESGGMALLPIYGLRVGYEAKMAVLLVAAVAWGNVVLQLPLGYLADIYNKRILLVICAFVGFVGAAIIPFVATNIVAMMIVLFVWGGFIAGFYTVGLTHLGSRFQGGDLASANAAFVMMYSVGSVIGPAAIGKGMDVWSPHGMAVVVAVFFGAYALLAGWRMLRLPSKSGSSQ